MFYVVVVVEKKLNGRAASCFAPAAELDARAWCMCNVAEPYRNVKNDLCYICKRSSIARLEIAS
jgi:hypothetical protein